MTDREKLITLAEHHGNALNIIMLSEEAGELMQAVSKWYRAAVVNDDWFSIEDCLAEKRADVLEELADIKICMDIIMLMLDITPGELAQEYDVKLDKDYERALNNEKI